MWGTPVPLIGVLVATLAINARYVLMGAALRPWFAGLPWARAYGSLFVMGDGNWALATRERAAGRIDPDGRAHRHPGTCRRPRELSGSRGLSRGARLDAPRRERLRRRGQRGDRGRARP